MQLPLNGLFFFLILIPFPYCSKADFSKTLIRLYITAMFWTPQWFHNACNKKSDLLSSVQFSSVAQSCPTPCKPMNRSTPGLSVHHQPSELTQTHVHRVSDAIQTSHPLSFPSPALNLSQHQRLFQWVSSSNEVAKVLEFQLQHQSFQWTPRTDFL